MLVACWNIAKELTLNNNKEINIHNIIRRKKTTTLLWHWKCS